MTTASNFDEFERVVARRGVRSGLPVIVAVHSSALGQAIGGCRLAPYPDWRDGLTDALRLSAAMTAKCAVAGLPHGGAKTVVALPPGTTLDTGLRRAVLHDVGDTIESLGGDYATGPDVGTGPDDMAVIGERTDHVFCRPVGAGGSGDSSGPTAEGVLAALAALAPVAGRRFAIMGLGRVGAHVARELAASGAELVVNDVDDSRRQLAAELGATWTDDILTAEADVLVPAALGGVLTAATVARLRCAEICGPANNQLDRPATADLLHERGILWAPDFVVSAGGVIHATGVELRGETEAEATARVRGIAGTLTRALDSARRRGITPLAAAHELARARIDSARQATMAA
ncbi:Glu/Leu/Phe/Val dehydrogenase dimerization domain-containing protein [Actinoplanes sp. CA-051413]|uniref:Glu/Leu/Phe/Val dehydrogenase dimerization domain-containing protein n=1 Tax=Actinoplanes sp. CA-051413 TaxID=3239899 RepID=UPI003D9512B6